MALQDRRIWKSMLLFEQLSFRLIRQRITLSTETVSGPSSLWFSKGYGAAFNANTLMIGYFEIFLSTFHLNRWLFFWLDHLLTYGTVLSVVMLTPLTAVVKTHCPSAVCRDCSPTVVHVEHLKISFRSLFLNISRTLTKWIEWKRNLRSDFYFVLHCISGLQAVHQELWGYCSRDKTPDSFSRLRRAVKRSIPAIQTRE